MNTENEKNISSVNSDEGAEVSVESGESSVKPKKIGRRILAFFAGLTKKQCFYLVGAFFLPFFLLFAAHAAVGFFPFGNSSILSLDFQAQYIYYFAQLRRVLTEGGGWFYTWSRTLGGEFMGYVAYYLGSPFNLLILLFSEENIPMAASFVILVKSGAMGVTMGYYLHKTRGTRGFKTLIFSTMYALCGYVSVQQYNPMWLDALIWLPLLVLGLERLVKERKIILYIVSLTLILTANYYIGYMCCIFTLIYFIHYYILVRPEILPLYESKRKGIRKFFDMAGTRSFLRIAGATVVAVFMSAFMLIAAYYSLQFGKNNFSNPSFAFEFRFDFLDIFVKMLLGSYDTVRPNGLPVVYSGIFALLLLPAFYMSKGIAPRKKVILSSMLLIIFVSFLLNPVDLAWHGFSSPVWLNYRYSFLFSFIVIVMACDAFATFETVKFGHFAASSAIMIAIVAIVQKFDYEFEHGSNPPLQLDDILCIGISILVMIAFVGLTFALVKIKDKKLATLALLIAVGVELLANSIISIARFQSDVGTVRYNNYEVTTGSYQGEHYDSYTGSAEKLRMMYMLIRENDSSFFRTESTVYRARGGVNEQMAAGYYGISSSTSTLNKKVINLMRMFGYASTSHWTKYLGGTPISDALLGIKYVISSDRPTESNGYKILQNNKHSFDSEIYVMAYEADEPAHVLPSLGYKMYVYQNTRALPIAYGVSKNLMDNTDYESTKYSPRVSMDLQNRLINSMLSETLGNVDVLKPLPMTQTTSNATVGSPYSWSYKDENDETRSAMLIHIQKVSSAAGTASVTFSTTAAIDGPVYFQLTTALFNRTVKLYLNGTEMADYFENGYIGNEKGCSLDLGTFSAGDTINLMVKLNEDDLWLMCDSESYFWYVDYDAMNKAFTALEDASLYVEDYNNEYIKGTINIPAGQELVFTTIPYDKGWHAYVDGKEVETTEVVNALLAFEATPGFHEIKLRYFPTEYKIGILFTAVGFAAFALIVAYNVSEKFRNATKRTVSKIFFVENGSKKNGKTEKRSGKKA